MDAGTALAPGAVSRITPCGKYLVFFSRKGREALADKFGAAFVSALGDVCETSAFAREALAALAAQQLNALAAKVKTRLGLTLSAGADVRDYVAAQCSPKQGAAGLSACCDKIFRALSEYCLQTDATLTGTITLTAREDGLDFALNDAGPQKLFDLLPAAYTGAVEEIRKELNDLVGLAPVKEYVFGLADNIQVQQRRAAAGLKTASLSMHMIFTGNPGTGKTTIARLVAKYLKAIGVLKGGQLVEVSRGDLVGRYTGHTAPLTNSVIQSALGGVLFIDEAYSLYRGEQDSFGLEAIDTLVKGMEDHRDELVVILAGYTREMEMFLTANSGLASRFPNKMSCWTSRTCWQRARATGWPRAARNRCGATTSAARQRMPARRATDVSPATRWKKPSSTRAAASWQSLRRSWMSSCPVIWSSNDKNKRWHEGASVCFLQIFHPQQVVEHLDKDVRREQRCRMAALDEPLFAVGSRHHIVGQLGQRAVAVTGDEQHRYIPPFGGSGHLFQPGALPGGREHDEDVFGGQRLSKGKVLLVDCAGNAPLAQVAEPDGGIEGHRQAAALGDHLHDLAAAQQREDLPQLAGVNGLNGGPQLLFAVCQNVQKCLMQLVLPFVPHTLGFLLLHGVPCQRQLEFAVVLEPQFVAQPGDGGLGRTAQPGQFC